MRTNPAFFRVAPESWYVYGCMCVLVYVYVRVVVAFSGLFETCFSSSAFRSTVIPDYILRRRIALLIASIVSYNLFEKILSCELFAQ